MAGSPRADVTVRPAHAAEWPSLRALLHRAFLDEPYTVSMYGDDPLARWSGSWPSYEALDLHHYSLVLVAAVNGSPVGVLTGSMPGECLACTVTAAPAPADPTEAIDWQFRKNTAAAHAAVGRHAWIDQVAVEPAARGLGIGRLLLRAAHDSMADLGPTTLLLECQQHRRRFYESAGFEARDTFSDPVGPDLFLMGRDVA